MNEQKVQSIDPTLIPTHSFSKDLAGWGHKVISLQAQSQDKVKLYLVQWGHGILGSGI